jgi:phosphoglycolate phosphatase
MKLKYKCVIFDLDGTLIDTLGDIAASMNKALRLRGFHELEDEEYLSKIGWGSERLAYLSLPEEARSKEAAIKAAKDFTEFYSEDPLHYSKVFPGISELINELKQKKIKTAVLSNKPDMVVQKIIVSLFPPGSFEHIQGEIAGNPRKPDPDCVWELLVKLGQSPANVIFLGDSEIHMETAVSSGCYAMGVSWGYRSAETILSAGAKRIIDDPTELLDMF